MLPDKIMKTSPSTRLFMTVSIVALVLLATYNGIVAPHISYLHATKQHQYMVNSASEKSEIIKKRIQQRKIELAQLHNKIADVRDSFFTPKIAKEFFLDLEPLSLQSNCSVESLSFTPPEPIPSEEGETENSGSVLMQRAELYLKGQYENIIRFLQRLSGYSQRIAIDNLYIESINPKSKELNCYMVITIYLIEDKEIVTDESN